MIIIILIIVIKLNNFNNENYNCKNNIIIMRKKVYFNTVIVGVNIEKNNRINENISDTLRDTGIWILFSPMM